MWRKVFVVLIALSLLFQQAGFASVAVEVDLAGHLARMPGAFSQDIFRPVHIRFFSFDTLNDNIKVMLDKGDLKSITKGELNHSTQELLNYFLVGLTLPNDTFWVNLRPDSEDNIIDDWLAKTDVGKIMLESDLQLKKDTAQFTSPATPEGKEYWNKLYRKAEELYGYQEVSIPTLTRPWIVPNEIIVRETKDSSYIYKATLKVMLEEDYLKSPQSTVHSPQGYQFKDPRAKALNEYSTQLIRELIIPKLTKEVNLSKRYSALRQVYYSLIFSRWFKSRFSNQTGKYASRIDRKDLTGLTSISSWSKTAYFNAYKKSFAQGEYNIKETVRTPTGQVIRSYFSGGIQIPENLVIAGPSFVDKASSALTNALGKIERFVVPDGMESISSPVKVGSSPIAPTTPIVPIIDQINHELKDQIVVERDDWNVSDDKGNVKNVDRLEATIPTIMYTINQGGTVVVISHNNRPGGKVVKEFSLMPVAAKFKEILRARGTQTEVIGHENSITEEGVAPGLKNRIVKGAINVLENTRFCPGDEKNDEKFAKDLAELGDIFVFNAFATGERLHASTGGIAKYMKKVVYGFLMEKETRYLEGALPVLKVLVVGGGPKLDEKLPVVMKVANNVQAGGTIILGTGPVPAFLKLKYNIDIGQKPSEQDLKNTEEIMKITQEKGIGIDLPLDFIATDRNLGEKSDGKKSWLELKTIPEGTNIYNVTLEQLKTGFIVAPDGRRVEASQLFVYGVGPKTIAANDARITSVDANRSVFWNGNLGVAEMPEFQAGDIELVQSLNKATEKGVITVIGGGDTTANAKKFKAKVTHISTGGGSSLAVLQGKKLEAVAELERVVKEREEKKTSISAVEISTAKATEILDSRLNPTVKTIVSLKNGVVATASIASGASTGEREALELRDGQYIKDIEAGKRPDLTVEQIARIGKMLGNEAITKDELYKRLKSRYNGKGVLIAVDNVNNIIAPRIKDFDVTEQRKIDETLIALDGTEFKDNLGANAILSVSLAVARAAARQKGMQLYEYVAELSNTTPKIPLIQMFNVINGGEHAGWNLDLQEFMIVPLGFGVGAKTYRERLEIFANVYAALKKILKDSGQGVGVGDEGGFAPKLKSNEEALALIIKATAAAGYKPGVDVALALDPAASMFFNNGEYVLKVDGIKLRPAGMVDYYGNLAKKYPIFSIEDGMAEGDKEGWRLITQAAKTWVNDATKALNRTGVQIVGDDLFVTNTKIFKEGIAEGLANSILIKLNQIGTLTETLDATKMAEENGYTTVISHRSGETDDDAIADIVVAISDQIKTGAARGERTAKHNRILAIEDEMLAVASSAVQIRTELKVPEGQKPGFFTNDYHGYTLSGLLARPIAQIPDAVVNAIQKKLNQDIADGKLLSAVVKDFAGTDIDIQVTHRYGELNAAVQKLILEAMKEGVLKAQQLGLLKPGVDLSYTDLDKMAKLLRVKYQPHSITERGSEPVVVVKIIGAGIGAANIKLYHEFFMPGATPLQKLGFVPVVGEKDKNIVRGFRAVVRRVDDVLKGNFDGEVWEFEKSSAANVKGKLYTSKDESLELLAFASQPNDFVITAIYPAEGSLLPANEPVVSIVYQPVYGEEGNLRTLNPTFLCKSQSGADAVGGVASMFYDVNFVPGGNNGERYVATKPVTLKEARKAPKEGTANVVVYGWQSELNGVIPREKGEVIDHVAINPPALGLERKSADWLASIMTTHQFDEPYLAPFAAEEQVAPIRSEQSHLFTRAPKEADIDPVMDEVEAKVASGKLLSVTDDKADMGGMFGHNFTPQYMLAIDKATVIEAQEKGILSDGNIIGFVDKMRLKRGITVSIGDDSHILMLGDKSRNSAESHQISFLGFTRGYLASMVGNTNEFDPAKKFEKPKKPYGRGQDFAGKEAKAAMANPYFYSQLSERFFTILREIMPQDYMQMVDNMEKGWRYSKETKKETALPDPFSGNVSQQGIGSARYLVDIASEERQFGILAGDKMGPAALNRIIREGVYAALNAGQFANGLVFEIWDAKAFDEHGNIPLDKLPVSYADVADAITSLKEQVDQDFVKDCYKDHDASLGTLRKLRLDEKERLAQLLKKSGYVPTERIFLDAQKDKEAIYLYLADSDRFNIKQVWSKKTPAWDINNFQASLDRPVLGSSVTKLGILAGGEYIGKDDPVMVGNIKLMKYMYEFLKTNPLIIQGDMNGSHWLGAIPTASQYAVANKESHPILVGQVYTLSADGKALASVEDIFGKKEYAPMRNKMFKFNFEFKKAQLGGQFEPYGTNWRTVEASYPLANLLRQLQAPDSTFLVRNRMNKPEAERQLGPIGIVTEAPELFKVAATASSAVEARRTPLMEKTLFGGNWKNRKQQLTSGQLVDFTEEGIRQKAREFKEKFSGTENKFKDAGLVLFIEGKWVKPVAEELKGTNIRVGVQSLFFGDSKNPNDFTPESLQGKIDKAVEMGAVYANVGHSMHRKGGQGLTDEQANKIMKAILADGRLIPWYTIEVTTENEETTRREIESGINMGLAGISEKQVVAFPITPEPSFKISTAAGVGVVDTSIKVSASDTAFLANLTLQALEVKYGHPVDVNTGYGASVKGDNAKDIFSDVSTQNALIGGASLEADDFYATVDNGMKGKQQLASSAVTAADSTASSPTMGAESTMKRGGIDASTSSALIPNKAGGIDFRANAMLINYKPMGDFASLKLDLPELSQEELAVFDVDKELAGLETMVEKEILPSGAHILEVLAASSQKGEMEDNRERMMALLIKVGILEEIQCCLKQASNEYKETLVLAEALP